MRTTITLDDDKYELALALSDSSMDKTDLFRVMCDTYIRVQAGKRLALLGGSTPDMADIQRQRDNA